MDYRNAIILVTGGGSGIGRAFVDRFLREGATVVACGRDGAKLQGLKAQHPSVQIRPCDITSSDEVKALIVFLTQEYGRLNILVNNAGVMEQVAILTGNVDDEAIAREIATNLPAPILLTRRLLPLLRRSHSPMILMVTSGYAVLPAERAPTYSATKAGLRSFTQALRYQLAHTGIRVVETLPPLVDTPSTTAVHRPKMTPAAVVDATFRAIAQGRVEIFLGEVRWLPLLMRIAPGFAARLAAKT
jgi:uncharacterized oxidoreductase